MVYFYSELGITNMSKMSEKKYKEEFETVNLMIGLFCHKKHKTKKGELCKECNELKDYCKYRLSLCPWGDKKSFCSNCKIHCYDKEHRERIKEVMRFSGPRMLFHHPKLAIKHVAQTLNQKRKMRKIENAKRKKENKA